MNTISKHIFSYIMIVVIFLSTLQWSITKMVCLKSGKTIYSIDKIEDCNTNKKSCSYSDVCCLFQKITFDFDYEFSLKSTTYFTLYNTWNTNLLKNLNTIPRTIASANFFTNSSPPSGYERLKFIQVFRL